MAKSSRRHSLTRKAARSSSNSPARTPKQSTPSLKSSSSNKKSRSRSRTRSTRSTPRSRSTSRNHMSTSPKKTNTVLQTVKKFNDFKTDVKKAGPLYRNPDNTNSHYKVNSYYTSMTDGGLRRRGVASRMLQPLQPSNLKVKGIRLKRRLAAHCRRHSRFYTSLLILGLITLGLGYAGYTIEQMMKYARNRVSMITAYIKKRR